MLLRSWRLVACTMQAALATFVLATAAYAQRFEVHEATIDQLQAALTAGRVTSVQLVDAYLQRIAAYDQKGPQLNAMIRLNPQARADAAALDAERRAGRVRGPLHGIPVILKDNFETRGWATSGSSVALAGMITDRDAFQVKKLREAGAIFVGKSNMHELAAGITTISSLGGQTRNPYDPTRLPGGSSGGTGAAVTASFAAIAWGSDTCGSIRIPASVHNLFGLRPTKGLSSIDGIIPLSHTQDVAGPLARTVRDLAIGLDATVGHDPNDTATALVANGVADFVAALDTTALRGKRFGVITSQLGDQPEDLEVTRVIRAALEEFKKRGATVIDVNFARSDSLAGRAGVIPFEFKYDLLDFLAARPSAAVKSLAEILEKGLYHVALEQSFRMREAMGTRDGEPYKRALAYRDSARRAVLALMDEQGLEALVYPTLRRKPALIGEPQRGGNCQVAAVTGLPAISIPAGFTPDGLPVGIELMGRPLSDQRLLALAYDYEQATRPRRPPASTPPLITPIVQRRITQAATSGAIKTTVSFASIPAGLSYDVKVAGARAEDVFAISITRGPTGPTLFHLAGPGRTQAAGTVPLSASEQTELAAGRLILTVYTRDQPAGATRIPLIIPPNH